MPLNHANDAAMTGICLNTVKTRRDNLRWPFQNLKKSTLVVDQKPRNAIAPVIAHRALQDLFQIICSQVPRRGA